MKYTFALLVALATVWWCWSGHTEPFILALGAASCTAVLVLCARMEILDSETVPIWLGLRPFTHYAPWLLWQVVRSNLDVSGRILRRHLPIQPTMATIDSTQRTELGRVILANSITLTPGTVSVDLEGRQIHVHALTPDSVADIDPMDRRVTSLEGV